MHLHSIQYGQFMGQSKEWLLSKSSFNRISLIVGKNASGKTRTLNIISGLANLLRSESTVFGNGEYDVDFIFGEDKYNFKITMDNYQVTRELLTCNEEELLVRDEEGKGTIYTKEVDKRLKFNVSNDQIASVVKRDSEQHEFLEPLHLWAESVLHYRFADDIEKGTFIAFTKNAIVQPRYKYHSIVLLKKGIDKFGEKFKSNILLDMKAVGYVINDVDIKQPDDVIITEGPPVHCLYVQEEDLSCVTEQTSMSNGMFRALSLLIKLNYILLENQDYVLSVDDIGEGLDFNRSKDLVDLVINKARSKKMQLIMSTNDQFIMNGVPLDYWSIADRKGSTVNIINIDVEPEVFEKFKFVGLNNFEFFASEFYKK